jgi:hypothetical protein
MQLASVMADEASPNAEPGAPFPKDAIDPELVNLRGPRAKVGVITSAGLVFLSILFFLRLNPDRRFAGASDTPDRVSVGDVLGGSVGTDRYVTLEAEPLISHAVRATTSKGSLGLRVVPARGTGERLWLALPGDGWEAPALHGYTGRLRRLSDLPFATAVRDYAREHPRPVFASADAVRAAFGSGKITGVGGESVAIQDGDRVAFDVVDPDAAVIVGTFTKYATSADWQKALADAGIDAKLTPATIPEETRFEVHGPNALVDVQAKLDKAGVYARVDNVTGHFDTTWGALKASPPPALAHADLVGLYVSRTIPDDAYALITGERPQDYWYVMWITIALGAVALAFAWAFVRALKRDVLTTTPRPAA